MPSATEKRSRVLCGLFALALFLFILTLSIALPIYIRPFYYAHIEALDLPETSGFAAGEIRQAYDEVLDYLTLPGREFGTGVMAWSQDGKSHFDDCKGLFDLNAGVLLGSGVCLLVILLLRRAGRIGPLRLGKRSAAFYGALGAIVLPLVLGGLAALDFDRAFVIFHTLFFPGKDNWIFDKATDEIIRVLPKTFFMNCAILIGAGVLLFSVSILIGEWIWAKRKNEL